MKKDLSFNKLRKVNKFRCETAFNHGLHSWSLAEWSNALAGEAGETCNITKKIKRGDFTLDEAKKDLAKEIADIVCYCDLLAAAADIDLGQSVIEKFNEVSDRRGVDIKL